MSDDIRDMHEVIYSRDNPESQKGPHGWIQWKGTDVCMDIHCACGDHGHVDADFFYGYECKKCGRKYAVGCNVTMIELNETESEWFQKRVGRFDHSDDETVAT